MPKTIYTRKELMMKYDLEPDDLQELESSGELEFQQAGGRSVVDLRDVPAESFDDDDDDDYGVDLDDDDE